MEITKGWSWTSLGIFIVLAILIALLFRKAVKSKKNDKKIKLGKIYFSQKYIYYVLIYIIYILFSCFRLIQEGIGGADTYNYINYFENLGYVHFKIKEMLTFNGFEYLFYNTMYFIKLFGGNFFTFLVVMHSVIIISYIYYVEKEINDENKCLWLILAFLPLLKSLNIIRNCVSATLGFVSISLLNNNKYKYSILFAVLAYLNHYIAIILFLLIIFYKVFPNKILKDKKKMIILNIASITFTIIALPILKYLIRNTGFSGYMDKIQVSLWGYIPYIAIYLTMIFNKNTIKYLEDCGHFGYYKMMSFLIIILPIFILLNGASRVLLFFELPIYVLSSDICELYLNYIPKKYKTLCRILIFLGIILWFIFRVYRMWNGYALMPYYNTLFM